MPRPARLPILLAATPIALAALETPATTSTGGASGASGASGAATAEDAQAKSDPFTIERSGDGSTTKTCTEAGVGGCPENGEW